MNDKDKYPFCNFIELLFDIGSKNRYSYNILSRVPSISSSCFSVKSYNRIDIILNNDFIKYLNLISSKFINFVWEEDWNTLENPGIILNFEYRLIKFTKQEYTNIKNPKDREEFIKERLFTKILKKLNLWSCWIWVGFKSRILRGIPITITLSKDSYIIHYISNLDLNGGAIAINGTFCFKIWHPFLSTQKLYNKIKS